MKKSLKAIALLAMTGALAAGSALTASAATSLYNGQWCDEGSNGWWYKLNSDGSVFLANTWYWIKDSDGVTRCYYFDKNGWLQTNTTIDGETVDANGRWTKNGEVQTTSSKDYATSVDFAKLNAATTSSSSSTTTTVNKNTVKNSSSSSSKTNAYKSSGQGDNPGSATFSQGYTGSTVSGSTAVNAWSNFQITLPSRPTVSSDGAGTDWVYEDDDKGTTISCSYRLVNEFNSSNTTLDGFISGYTSSAKGFAKAKSVKKKGKAGSMCSIENAGTKTFGGISFTMLKREALSPSGTGYDYAYVRLVPGTSYVQVIEITGGETYDSVLSTISKVS